MIKSLTKIFLIITFLNLVFFLIVVMVSKNNNNENLKPVSLPEEISEAKPGDKLFIISLSDSIYVGFNNSKN
jgi:hypothetical protein